MRLFEFVQFMVRDLPYLTAEGYDFSVDIFFNSKKVDLTKILEVFGERNEQIEILTADSRKVAISGVFFALKGAVNDGHQFLTQVVEKNPLAVVVENFQLVPVSYSGLIFIVSDSRTAFARACQWFYDEPNLDLKMIGITGTNGKTSTTNIIEFLLSNLNSKCGVIGTIHNRLETHIWPAQNTTPGPFELALLLKEMKVEGAKCVAMEVSSHALDQKRVEGVDFDVVVFTNLTRDHLDYHKTMKAYFDAKQRLFSDLLYFSRKSNAAAVINVDDEWGRQLLVSQQADVQTFGQSKDAQWRFQVTGEYYDRTEFSFYTPDGIFSAVIPLCGVHNLYNTVGSIIAVRSLYHEPITPQLIAAMARFPGVKGRLELVNNRKSINAFVDYAHSPDALENVLRCLDIVRKKANSRSRIITVFGCGGDRDKGKRPMMAEIASRFSELVIVTSDNPRSEDPNQIIDDIYEGVPVDKANNFLREVDRKIAIEKALSMANSGDVVLVAGKGHEDYQEIKGQKHFFEDHSVIRDWMPT